MGRSFKDSLEKIQTENINRISTAAITAQDVNNYGIATLESNTGTPVVYVGEDEIWKKDTSGSYRYFTNGAFDDINVSSINEKKDILLDVNQFNITQEENSQYIPFIMPRYYDGYDLSEALISIHYSTSASNDNHGNDKAVNVFYGTDKIKFGWLVSRKATSFAGKLKFEIHADGTVIDDAGQEYGYTWKTRSSESLTVFESLCGDSCKEINIDDSWVQDLVESVAVKVAEKIATANVETQVQRAEDAATSAESYRDEAQQAATDAANQAISAVQSQLDNYATTEYVNEQIENIDVTEELQNYATTEYVNEQISNIDVTDQLNNYAKSDDVNNQFSEVTTEIGTINDRIEDVETNLNDNYLSFTQVSEAIISSLEPYAKMEYVNEQIQNADISGKLNDYYKKEETYNQTEIDEKLDNASVNLVGYATEAYVDNKNALLSTDINTNKENISSLSTAIGDLQETVNSIDTTPGFTYDIVYNDVDNPDIGENGFGFYEIRNEGQENEVRELKQKFVLVGGSSGSSSSLKISYVTTSPIITTVNDKVLIAYNFSGTDSSGDVIPEANYTWKIGTKIIASGIATNGENIFDATEFATTSSQKITLTISDDIGNRATKSWTVQQVDVRLESSFSDAYPYSGDVSFAFTPYGSIEKTIHFVLDGEEIGTMSTSNSGIPVSFVITKQEYGSHLLDVYMTATINNILIESNHISKDIIWIDDTNSSPVIGCATTTINVMQYSNVNIKYVVVDPKTETPDVTLYVNDNILSVEKLTDKDAYGYYSYIYKANDYGTFTFGIQCGDAERKNITINVEKLNIDVSPVTAGLEFDFNPVGFSNSSSERLWSYNTVNMEVSDNFDWINGGYQIDDNGDQYFCVKAGTTATINYNLFADDPKRNGKEFKIIFRTQNIRKRDTSFLSCMNDNIGLDMKVEYAIVSDSGGLLKSNYCEDTIIEYEFNIKKDTEMMIVMSYEDGTPGKPYEYKETSSFKQALPQPITIGSPDCDVLIYRIKAYSLSLTDTDIKNNFIADARNAEEMIARYQGNQIYNSDGKVVSTSASGDFNVDALMKAAPDLRYIFLEVPQFTTGKENKIDGCTVYFRYPAGKRSQDNWTCTGMRHRGQGTSSELYGDSGRNVDLCMDRSTSLFTWVDEEGRIVESKTITLTDTSVPTDYLNVKVNIASSENQNNAGMAKRFNDYQPFLRYARKKDSRIKDTMEFYNCVLFIRETSTDSSVPHREFNDTDWHFYAMGNVGDSKKTDDTRVNDKNDPKEHVVEIMDVDKPLVGFWTGKDNNEICEEGEWTTGNPSYDILYSTNYIYDEEGEFESFGNESFEFRYEMDGITTEQRENNINAWRNLYTFLVTSSDEYFYNHLKDYFVVDSALYYYLFTERYTMVDNRAKNSFWHYGKVYISSSEAIELGETEASYYIIDDDAAAINDGYRYDLTFGYDFDTCLGIDNTGDYVFSYGKEDTDYYVDDDPSSDYVFRIADSTFFCRLRDNFKVEMQAMFKDREEKNAWDSNSLITQWDHAQAQFPEELWRLDYERKYYRPYLGLAIDNSIPRGIDKTFLIGKFFGRKKYSRRAYEINQGVYFATKYFGNQILKDVVWIRGNVPIGGSIQPNYSLTLVPYSDMYVCVQYGSTGTPIHQKIKAGETCVFESSETRMDFIYIYAASYIQEIGDLSKCFIGDNNFVNAIRLQKLEIGSTDDGYENTFMKEVLLANNTLLEYLDVRNVSGLNTVINVSGCSNLKELYAEGTNASGVIFANGGLLRIAHLPKISSLSMKNLHHLEEFMVDGYNNLHTLIVENVPNINTYEIINLSPILKIVRLIDLNWTYQITTTDIFERMLTLSGIDSSGYETDLSVLTGKTYIPTIKQKELSTYESAWPDLTIECGSVIPQFAVTFMNADGEILEVQYVVSGENAVDPTKRLDNPLIPTLSSTISHEFTFRGWDNPNKLLGVAGDRTITATYDVSVRQYVARYVSNPTGRRPITMYETTADYGSNVLYPDDYEIPVYTDEEISNKFYLFKKWDKSGFLDNGFDENGVKIINAVFDEVSIPSIDTYFNGKELKDLTPVEIYALTKINTRRTPGTNVNEDPYYYKFAKQIIEDQDEFMISVGNDVDFDDIESDLLISEKTVFDGTNCIDFDGTNGRKAIRLFEEDRDFVLAIDYEMDSESSVASVLAQCYQSIDGHGFRIFSNTNVELAWGENDTTLSTLNNREIVVVCHKKGQNNLFVYRSNFNGSDGVDKKEIVKNEVTLTTLDTSTLIFGCGKRDNGLYENYSIGSIYWAKIWYKDLGDSACRSLAEWIHEKIRLQSYGFQRYKLSEDTTNDCSFSLIASHLLSRKNRYYSSSVNSGGWAASHLNNYLNNRLYNAMPMQIKNLLQKVRVPSTIGNKSSTITYSDCYIYVPSLVEVNPTYQTESPYSSEGYPISFMYSDTGDGSRQRGFDGGDYEAYWLRSPNAGYTNYIWHVRADGSTYGIITPTNDLGILIEISF